MHKNVEISRAETMCTFSLRFFCILQICKGSVAYGHTDRQTHLEDASRIKNVYRDGLAGSSQHLDSLFFLSIEVSRMNKEKPGSRHLLRN